jgi:hypothetical protein
VRTFSCFLFSKQSSVPDLFLIDAANEQRARALARREYLAEKAIAVELCEGNEVLWRETAEPPAGLA